MSVDYSIYYRTGVDLASIGAAIGDHDVFISAYTANERVLWVYGEVQARRKIWLIHPEYQFADVEAPQGVEVLRPDSRDEYAQVEAIISAVPGIDQLSLCIDITGFMKHVLIFLVAKLRSVGVASFTAIYSEPDAYVHQEQTAFTTSSTGVVRPIMGMAGSNASSGKDHLIVAVGYDHLAVGEVTNNKDAATVHPLFGFPSLSPDMYQQSSVRAARSGDKAIEKEWVTNRRFAPANDPFATATVLSGLVESIDRGSDPANIYLSPLSTKAQALGFAIYWCIEGCARDAVTMLMPECVTYSRDTSVGLKRVWKFDVELH